MAASPTAPKFPYEPNAGKGESGHTTSSSDTCNCGPDCPCGCKCKGNACSGTWYPTNTVVLSCTVSGPNCAFEITAANLIRYVDNVVLKRMTEETYDVSCPKLVKPGFIPWFDEDCVCTGRSGKGGKSCSYWAPGSVLTEEVVPGCEGVCSISGTLCKQKFEGKCDWD